MDNDHRSGNRTKSKASAGKSGAESQLAKLLSSKEPMTKEKATEALRLFAAAGRIKAPSSGMGA